MFIFGHYANNLSSYPWFLSTLLLRVGSLLYILFYTRAIASLSYYINPFPVITPPPFFVTPSWHTQAIADHKPEVTRICDISPCLTMLLCSLGGFVETTSDVRSIKRLYNIVAINSHFMIPFILFCCKHGWFLFNNKIQLTEKLNLKGINNLRIVVSSLEVSGIYGIVRPTMLCHLKNKTWKRGWTFDILDTILPVILVKMLL